MMLKANHLRFGGRHMSASMLEDTVRTTRMAKAGELGKSEHTQHAHLYGDQVQNSGDRSLATRLPVGCQNLQVFLISELHPVTNAQAIEKCCNAVIVRVPKRMSSVAL